MTPKPSGNGEGRYGSEHIALAVGGFSAIALLVLGACLAPSIGGAWLVFLAAAGVDLVMAVVLFNRIRTLRLKCPACGGPRQFTPDGLRCPDCDA